MVKIGYTFGRTASPRRNTLQQASPDLLLVIGQAPGSFGHEQRLHSQLQNYRVHGEWFQPYIAEKIIELTMPVWVEQVLKAVTREDFQAIGLDPPPAAKASPVIRTKPVLARPGELDVEAVIRLLGITSQELQTMNKVLWPRSERGKRYYRVGDVIAYRKRSAL